jgi:hypothetical protein
VSDAQASLRNSVSEAPRSSSRTASFVAVAFLVVVAVSAYLAAHDKWSPEAWAALAAWVTAGIAVVAGILALGQLTEARSVRLAQEKSRREQAQPYVVAHIEETSGAQLIYDLVIRNYGATAAFDVRLMIDPPPQRAIDRNEPPNESGLSWLPERLSLLVPGQEWRTLWDNFERANTDLPDRHDVTITFRDSDGQDHEYKTVLDWADVKNRQGVNAFGIHEPATALREINKTLKRWGEPSGTGLRVWGRDGERSDRRRMEKVARLRASRQPHEESDVADDDAADAESPGAPG